jgi:hypothetical protein
MSPAMIGWINSNNKSAIRLTRHPTRKVNHEHNLETYRNAAFPGTSANRPGNNIYPEYFAQPSLERHGHLTHTSNNQTNSMNMNYRSTFQLIRTTLLIAAVGFASSAEAQNIVLNGSFEQTDAYGQPYNWSPVGMLLRWPNAPDGGNYAYIGTVSQTLTTISGQTYTLSFYAAGDLYVSQTSTVNVGWGGQNAATFTTNPHPYDSGVNRYLQIVWQQFSTTVTASSASTLLSFTAANNTGLLLDDVRVIVVPEPTNIALLLIGAAATIVTLRKRTLSA